MHLEEIHANLPKGLGWITYTKLTENKGGLLQKIER